MITQVLKFYITLSNIVFFIHSQSIVYYTVRPPKLEQHGQNNPEFFLLTGTQ